MIQVDSDLFKDLQILSNRSSGCSFSHELAFNAEIREYKLTITIYGNNKYVVYNQDGQYVESL